MNRFAPILLALSSLLVVGCESATERKMDFLGRYMLEETPDLSSFTIEESEECTPLEGGDREPEIEADIWFHSDSGIDTPSGGFDLTAFITGVCVENVSFAIPGTWTSDEDFESLTLSLEEASPLAAEADYSASHQDGTLTVTLPQGPFVFGRTD